MNNQYIFKCDVTLYRLEYIVNPETHTALLNTIISDFKYPKALCNLIRTSIEKLKKENIKKIRQYVCDREWGDYLENKTTWKVVRVLEEMSTISYMNLSITKEIECDIDDFLENFGVGIGLDEI